MCSDETFISFVSSEKKMSDFKTLCNSHVCLLRHNRKFYESKKPHCPFSDISCLGSFTRQIAQVA